MKFGRYFSEETRRQAQMFYLINYSLKFPNIKEEREGYTKLKDKIEQVLSSYKLTNNEFKYCGFVWFVIPKIILNLKITWKESQNPCENEEDNR